MPLYILQPKMDCTHNLSTKPKKNFPFLTLRIPNPKHLPSVPHPSRSIIHTGGAVMDTTTISILSGAQPRCWQRWRWLDAWWRIVYYDLGIPRCRWMYVSWRVGSLYCWWIRFAAAANHPDCLAMSGKVILRCMYLYKELVLLGRILKSVYIRLSHIVSCCGCTFCTPRCDPNTVTYVYASSSQCDQSEDHIKGVHCGW